METSATAVRQHEATDANLEIRPLESDDRAFVVKSWLNSYRLSPFGRQIVGTVYWDGQKAAIDRILSRPGTTAQVACLASSPYVLFGYVVTEGDVLHYVFVKPDARNYGIGSALLASAEIPKNPRLSHVTDDWSRYLRNRYPQSRWDPYLVG